MKKFKLAAVVLCVAIMVTSLCACSGGEMESGTFENNTYTNKDMGIAITIDDSFTYTYLEEEAKPFEAMDFVNFFGVTVVKEDMGSMSMLVDEKKMAEMIEEKTEEVGFTSKGITTKTLAGKSYQVVQVYSEDAGLSQDYYIAKVKSNLACLIVTFSEENLEYAENFLANNIKAA